MYKKRKRCENWLTFFCNLSMYISWNYTFLLIINEVGKDTIKNKTNYNILLQTDTSLSAKIAWGGCSQQVLSSKAKNLKYGHCRNGTWNKGGFCDTEREPQTNYTRLEAEPTNNKFISDVIKQMRYENRRVQFLNITYLTEFRKDSHPSLHREPGTPPDAPQDCSHWCLPGVPDTWNELLYAYLLSMGFRTKWVYPTDEVTSFCLESLINSLGL